MSKFCDMIGLGNCVKSQSSALCFANLCGICLFSYFRFLCLWASELDLVCVSLISLYVCNMFHWLKLIVTSTCVFIILVLLFSPINGLKYNTLEPWCCKIAYLYVSMVKILVFPSFIIYLTNAENVMDVLLILTDNWVRVYQWKYLEKFCFFFFLRLVVHWQGSHDPSKEGNMHTKIYKRSWICFIFIIFWQQFRSCDSKIFVWFWVCIYPIGGTIYKVQICTCTKFSYLVDGREIAVLISVTMTVLKFLNWLNWYRAKEFQVLQNFSQDNTFYFVFACSLSVRGRGCSHPTKRSSQAGWTDDEVSI